MPSRSEFFIGLTAAFLGGYSTIKKGSMPSLARTESTQFALSGHGNAVTIAISVPGNGINLSGTVPVTVDASPTPNRIDLYIDGVRVGYATNVASYTYQWNTTAATDGTHTLKAVGVYKTKQSTSQIAVTVTNTAAVFTVVISGSPVQGQWLSAQVSPSGSYTYRWWRCDADGLNPTDTGASGSSYLLSANDVGYTMRVVTTSGGVSVTSSQTALVVASAPAGSLAFRPPGWNGSNPMLATSFPGYTVLDIAADGSNREVTLSTSTDYYVRIGGAGRTPYSAGFGIELHGGRNIVIVGGSILLDGSQTGYGGGTHSLIIWNPTGTVHIEGVNMDHPYSGTAVSVRAANTASSPNWAGYAVPSTAIIQIQNCRIRGQVPANAVDKPGWWMSIDHPDAFQFEGTVQTSNQTVVPTWWDGFPGTVRFDKVTAITGYQGVATGTWPQGTVYVKRLNVRQIDDGAGHAPGAAIYQEFRNTYTMTVENFWIEAVTGKPLSAYSYTYPNLNGRSAVSSTWINAFGGGYGQDAPVYGTDQISNYREYPVGANIAGRFREGIPPGGDYCPAGVPGSSYVSPGYQ